jgi:hypothetical protein
MDLMPGERLDVLVDLTGNAPGTKIVMQNIGPDSPYGGPAAGDPPSVDIPEIMEFNVITLASTNSLAPSAAMNLRPVSGAVVPLVPTPGTAVRKIALEEIVDQYGRTMPTIDQRGFMQMGVPATEIVRLNDTEQWDLINNTVDAHPMHLHLVQFQVVSRQTFTSFVSAVTDTVNGIFGQPSYAPTGYATTATSDAQGVEPWEAGWKDTIDCPPGLVTTIKAKFDIAGDKYVYHCHILSHEEHDMMRPLAVVDPLPITWYNTGSGQVYVQTTDGAAVSGSAIVWTEADTAWSIVGKGDLNGDNVRDYVWRNSTSGQVYVMLMSNNTAVSSGAVVWTEPDAAWRIVATGDLNGDKKSDLIWWNNTTGQVFAMLMNGAAVSNNAIIWTEPDLN